MAENKPIEVRYYRPAPDDALVFNRIWGLVDTATGQPITNSISAAYLHIAQDGKQRLELSLGDGLTWNDTDKSVLVQITNSKVQFIRTTTDMTYSFYVVWDHGAAQTIREGTVTAVKVD